MTDQWRAAVATVLHSTERAVSGTRHVLNRVQLRIHALRVALDPSTRAWVEEMKGSVADGTIWSRVGSRDDLLRRIEEERHSAR